MYKGAGVENVGVRVCGCAGVLGVYFRLQLGVCVWGFPTAFRLHEEVARTLLRAPTG